MNREVDNSKVNRGALSGIFTQFISRKIKIFKFIDWPIVILLTIISLIGLVAVFSATMYHNPMNQMITQLFAMIIGYIVMFSMLLLPDFIFTNFFWVTGLNLLAIVLLFLTFIFGIEVNGAQSWIEILGVTFQPSELFKITSILLIAWFINHVNREEILSQKTVPKYSNQILIMTLLIGLGFIVKQPDYGMLSIIIGTLVLTFSLMILSPKQNILLYLLLIMIYSMIRFVSIKYGEVLVTGGSHALERIAVFTNPFNFEQEAGYQIIEGYKAIANGGWFGVGIGNGQAKYDRLPAIETDYIIANIAEEVGFVGVLLLIFLFAILIFFLFQRAAQARDIQRRAIIIGVSSIMLIQIIVNIAGVLSIIPLTGVTLPFISYGGTSLLVSYIIIGLALRMIAEEKQLPKINLVYSRKE